MNGSEPPSGSSRSSGRAADLTPSDRSVSVIQTVQKDSNGGIVYDSNSTSNYFVDSLVDDKNNDDDDEDVCDIVDGWRRKGAEDVDVEEREEEEEEETDYDNNIIMINM